MTEETKTMLTSNSCNSPRGMIEALHGWVTNVSNQREYSLALQRIEAELSILAQVRRALGNEANAGETPELLSIARDLSTMDCFWSASGHHEADCKCLSGRAERAIAAHAQKAYHVDPTGKTREPPHG